MTRVDLGMLTKLALSLYEDIWVRFHFRVSGQSFEERVVAVPGRPLAEDEEREIDRFAESQIEGWAGEHDLPFQFLSEHRKFGKLELPEAVVFVDPFECTDEFTGELPLGWFSPVLSIFDPTLESPLAACALDLLIGRIWLASPEEGIQFVQLPNAPWCEVVRRRVPDSRTTFRAQVRKVRIASYLGNPFYSSALMDRDYLWNLHRRFPRLRFFAHGGSCVYPMIAGGLLNGYIMAVEPDTETNPGLAFMKIAKCPVVSVDPETGEFEEYRPDPEHPEHRTDLLIAACNEGMLRTILSEFVGPLLPIDLNRQKEEFAGG